jgi:hypothetical protein
MPVREILQAAVQAVEEAQIPEDLRVVAFGKAVDLVATDAVDSGVGPRTAQGTPGRTSSGGGPVFSERLQTIANALGVSGAQIEMIYTEHGDALQVVADPNDLGSSTKERAKSIALLIAGGRQLGRWDEGATSDELVRHEVDRLGLYDSTNYAKHVKELTAWFNVNGAGRTATYKLKYAGRQHLKDLAARLATVE